MIGASFILTFDPEFFVKKSCTNKAQDGCKKKTVGHPWVQLQRALLDAMCAKSGLVL